MYLNTVVGFHEYGVQFTAKNLNMVPKNFKNLLLEQFLTFWRQSILYVMHIYQIICHKSEFSNAIFKNGRLEIGIWIRMLHCKPIPVMKTGFSLCSISNSEKPVFINWEPCNENRFFPVWKYYTGKTLFLALYWPCTGLQCC